MIVNFNPGPSKLLIAKTLKDELHIGRKEAKHFTDTKQFVCSEEEFSSLKAALKEVGASEFEVL